VLPAKCDEIEVEPGDMLIYRTAGGGGWKDRLDRPVEAVERDVAFGLVSREKALSAYGVVVGDPEATERERERQRVERGDALAFDFGPSLEETLASCEAETGLPAPKRAKPLRWSPLEDAAAAQARVRAALDG
jgi:N-methylhydantoinase B